MLDLPDARYEGQLDYGCGLTCVRCVLEWSGKSMSFSDRLHPDPDEGLSPSELSNALSLAGLHVVEGTWSLDMLKKFGHPVICFVNTEDGADHYIVARGVARGRVYYFDPDKGLTSARVDQFMDRWHSVGTDGSLLRYGGIGVGK